MKHLTRDELVDLAEGSRQPASAPHLESCAACRGQLEKLQALIARVADVEVPEPSPLFWEQLSARVSGAVAAEAAHHGRPWHERLAIGGWRVPLRIVLPLSIGVTAACVIAVALTMNARRPAVVAVPVPAMADSAVPTEAVEGTALLPPDDPTLDVVADMGTELDWEQVHDAGIVAHTGLVDRAVKGLSANERAELGKLLKQELAGGGN